jgi:hypothetical protein
MKDENVVALAGNGGRRYCGSASFNSPVHKIVYLTLMPCIKIALIQLKAYLHSNVTDYHGCVENR